MTPYAESEHAARWATSSRKKTPEITWSKWHWTQDANFTICGVYIPIAHLDDGPTFPRTSDELFVVDCKNCKRKLGLT